MQCVQLLLVESWHEKQYTCLVVKRRTAVASPATSTIIATVCVGAGSIESGWWESAECVLLLLSRGTKGSNTLVA